MDVLPLQQQREHRRYFVRLGSLSEELRLFAHLHSTARIQQVWQGMQGALAQLHCILELVGRAQPWFCLGFIAVLRSFAVPQLICLS